MTILRIAQAQMPVCTERKQLIRILESLAEQAVRNHADLLSLPEMFCCPYDVCCFPAHAEEEGGPVQRKREVERERKNEEYIKRRII